MPYLPTKEELYEALSPILLKNNPKEFLENLKTCIEHKIDIKDYINDDGKYETWYSPLPICLYYLVGDLEEPYEKNSYNFYGCKETIDQYLGIEIIKCLHQAGADYSIENYYEENLLDVIQREQNNNTTLTTRKNNKIFIKYITECILY